MTRYSPCQEEKRLCHLRSAPESPIILVGVATEEESAPESQIISVVVTAEEEAGNLDEQNYSNSVSIHRSPFWVTFQN